MFCDLSQSVDNTVKKFELIVSENKNVLIVQASHLSRLK